jgi:hypothetical protein
MFFWNNLTVVTFSFDLTGAQQQIGWYHIEINLVVSPKQIHLYS